MSQKRKRKGQEERLEDAEELIKSVRTTHVALMGEQGQLLGQEKASVMPPLERSTLNKEL